MGEHLNLSTGDVEGLLADTRRALERMRRPSAEVTPEPTELIRGEGEGGQGKVHAVAKVPGRIEILQMDPRLMRDGSEAVCEAIVDAINAALEDLQNKVVGGTTIDAVELSGELERLQEQSLDSARSMMAALQDAMDRIERRM
ncbi:YbaB/EbfC family nucleoid-associated protein [Actinopolymorpha alba]|uniref:YbaB/EbfC family nucleoid-associated protein n=1 Tax=Actinopolymorpha alba TaxID=533267 RepID=UPI000365B618|nr:YbaB/EbfC family nucleoid-associated protein [Actinopolymorpha alba]